MLNLHEWGATRTVKRVFTIRGTFRYIFSIYVSQHERIVLLKVVKTTVKKTRQSIGYERAIGVLFSFLKYSCYNVPARLILGSIGRMGIAGLCVSMQGPMHTYY